MPECRKLVNDESLFKADAQDEFRRAQQHFNEGHWTFQADGPFSTMLACCSCGWTVMSPVFRNVGKTYKTDWAKGQSKKHRQERGLRQDYSGS